MEAFVENAAGCTSLLPFEKRGIATGIAATSRSSLRNAESRAAHGAVFGAENVGRKSFLVGPTRALLYARRHGVSRRQRGAARLRASHDKRGEEGNSSEDIETSVAKRQRPWWNLMRLARGSSANEAPSTIEEVHIDADERPTEKAPDLQLEEKESEKQAEIGTSEKTGKWPWQQTTATSDGESSSSRDSSIEPLSEASDDCNNNRNPLVGILRSLEKLPGAKEDDTSDAASAPDEGSGEDVWTKILDVIAPNRKPIKSSNQGKADNVNDNEPSQSENGDKRSLPPPTSSNSEENTATEGPTKARRIVNPLDRLRGIREVYSAPRLDLRKRKDTDMDSEKTNGKEEGKHVSSGNVISRLLPWLGQSGDAETQSSRDTTEDAAAQEPPASSEERIVGNSERSDKGRVPRVSSNDSERVTEKQRNAAPKMSGVRPGQEPLKEPQEQARAPVQTTVSERNETAREQSGSRQNGESRRAGTATKRTSSNGVSPSPESIEGSSVPQKDVAAIRLIFGSETFFATETLSPPGGLIFRGNLRGEPKATLAKLEKRLEARLGDKYTLCLAEGEDLRPVVVVVPTARDRQPATPRQKLFAVTVAAVTLATCLARGVYATFYSAVTRSVYETPTNASVLEKLFARAPASTMGVSIAVIVLLSHLVQRFVASRRKTKVALPYLIPSYQLGSFGAVVQLASPTPTRAALFDIAFSGAASLFLISLAVLVVGLRLSTSFSGVIPVSMSMVSSSMLIGALTTYVPQGQILVDYGRSWIGLHPLAVVGANCITIAALNLLPIRQLDGGRIVSAIYGRKTAGLASRVTIFFLLLASAKIPFYFLFLVSVTVGPWSIDRPAKNELTEPDNLRAIIGYLFLLLMITVLLPHPASKLFGTA